MIPAVIFILCAFAFFFAGPKKQVKTLPRHSQIPLLEPEQITMTLYFADQDALYVCPEKRTVKKTDAMLEELVLQELVKGPRNPGLDMTIPPESRLLSVKVENGVAYVNFSRELQTTHWGGSAGETMTIYSIVNSLTEIPYIKKVQLLLENRIEQSIWGHAVTSEPIARNIHRIKQ